MELDVCGLGCCPPPTTVTTGKASTLFENVKFHLDTLRLGRHIGLQEEEEKRQREMTKTSGRPTEYVPPWRRLLQ